MPRRTARDPQHSGTQAVLLGCGAPLLPRIGLVDAMRVGPDVLPEDPDAVPDLARESRRHARAPG